MARQTGEVKLTGTYGNITCYEMNGEHFARLKSSLTGKRVKKDPAFRLTMMYAGWLAKASRIASVVYQSLPEDQREHMEYRTMTGIAMKMLKAGLAPELIVDHLMEVYTPAQPVETIEPAKSAKELLLNTISYMYVMEDGRLVSIIDQSSKSISLHKSPFFAVIAPP